MRNPPPRRWWGKPVGVIRDWLAVRHGGGTLSIANITAKESLQYVSKFSPTITLQKCLTWIFNLLLYLFAASFHRWLSKSRTLYRMNYAMNFTTNNTCQHFGNVWNFSLFQLKFYVRGGQHTNKFFVVQRTYLSAEYPEQRYKRMTLGFVKCEREQTHISVGKWLVACQEI